MAWEERNGRSYYYEKRRQGGRVVSQYIGTGELARLAAQLTLLDQWRKEEERAEWRLYQAEQAALDAEIAELAQLVQTVTGAVLLASGCHRHKRQWRVKHEQNADSDNGRDEEVGQSPRRHNQSPEADKGTNG